MRLTYARLPAERRHPLGRDAVRRLLAETAPEAPALLSRVRAIHFGWNGRTTQEGRIVQHGAFFEIRINFTVEGERSRLLRSDARWLRGVTRCGGFASAESGWVSWPAGSAEQYCSFLILHELAHAVYAQSRTHGAIVGWGGASQEESFCDEWALSRVGPVR